nr:uncharacterized protein LOC123568825 [Macaca fascicularis]
MVLVPLPASAHLPFLLSPLFSQPGTCPCPGQPGHTPEPHLARPVVLTLETRRAPTTWALSHHQKSPDEETGSIPCQRMWLRRAVRTVDHVEQDIPGKPPPSQRKFWRGWSHRGGPAAPIEPAHVREAGVWGLQVAGGPSNSNGVTEEPQPPRASCLCSGVPPWLRKSFAPYCTLKTPTHSSEPSTEVAPEAWPLRGKARGTQQPGTAAHTRTISVGACAGGCPVSLCPHREGPWHVEPQGIPGKPQALSAPHHVAAGPSVAPIPVASNHLLEGGHLTGGSHAEKTRGAFTQGLCEFLAPQGLPCTTQICWDRPRLETKLARTGHPPEGYVRPPQCVLFSCRV